MDEKNLTKSLEEIADNNNLVTIKDYLDKNIQFIEDVDIKDIDKRRLVLEQYKVVVDSLKNIEDVREKSNSFWVTVNSLGITIIAYIRQAEGISHTHKPILLWTLLILGFVLCISWIRSLYNIKKMVEIDGFLLVTLEKYLPAKVFTTSFKLLQREQGKSSLTLKEMMVPCLFLLGYALFAGMLFYFQEEIAIIK